MTSSYAALCSDFYVNLRLNLKMELPSKRESTLGMFDRIRRQFPGLSRFRRYKGELALETAAGSEPQQWVSQRRNSVRAGCVNPSSIDDALALHRAILEVSPYYLDISPLDIDYVELLYGFDLAASGNHNSIVLHALVGGAPVAAVADAAGARVIDCQPMIGLELPSGVQAHFEVKTRSAGSDADPLREEPISVYLTARRLGPVGEISELPGLLDALHAEAEELVDNRLVPDLLMPIRNAIATGHA